MTFTKLASTLYYQYSIKTVTLSQEIVRANSKSILSALPAEWEDTTIYAQLKEIEKTSTSKSDLRLPALNILSRRVGRSNSRASLPQTSLETNGSPFSHDSPGPHGSKSIVPPHSGRRSGKEASLRLAPSPALKRGLDRDDSSEEENTTFRNRKRRRPIPEMGDDDEDENDSPDQVDNEADNELVELQVVREVLPTLEPTGPNGMWTCDREDCVFIVRDAESVEGRKEIRKHFNEHAAVLEREVLVKKEAASRRFPIRYIILQPTSIPIHCTYSLQPFVFFSLWWQLLIVYSHLLEKLKSLGQSSRMAEQSMINGRVVPEPIKRSMAA
jgi:hypothetical protein